MTSTQTMPDEQLASAAEEALSRLTPKARAFTLATAGGTALVDAAREAGLSTDRGNLWRLQRRCEPVLGLLREQARRASMLTLEAAVAKFRTLAEEARAARDYSAATRALSEACKLLSLYPEMRLKLSVEQTNLAEVTPEEWEQLARLRHQVRQLPAGAQVVDAEVLPPQGRLACHPGEAGPAVSVRTPEPDPYSDEVTVKGAA
jgi:hypothetical protein